MLTVENLNGNYSYVVCDLLGKEVLNGKVSIGEYTLDFGGLFTGMYILKLKDKGGAITIKKVFKN